MEKKYLVLGGLTLLAVAFIGGILFSPSGYLVVGKEIACIKVGTGSERCDGAEGSDFWKDKVWNARNLCEEAADEYGNGCGWQGYVCSCKQLSNN